RRGHPRRRVRVVEMQTVGPKKTEERVDEDLESVLQAIRREMAASITRLMGSLCFALRAHAQIAQGAEHRQERVQIIILRLDAARQHERRVQALDVALDDVFEYADFERSRVAALDGHGA